MSGRRKLTLGLLAAVALAAAGLAGAAVRYTIFTIGPDREAHLAGTGIYCLSTKATTPPYSRLFTCDYFVPNSGSSGDHVAVGSYGFSIGEFGVSIHRGAPGNRLRHIRQYSNP
jgi:hypothetical protein